MAQRHLERYLSDHLAGAAGAIQLMQQIERTHGSEPAGIAVSQVKSEVEADRAELQRLADRLGAAAAPPRRAVAWVGEHLAQLKLRLDDPSDGGLRLLEAIEAISLGIEGKKSLWRALAASAVEVSALQSLDYDRLIARAEQQRTMLESHRLSAATTAFAEGEGQRVGH